MGAVLDIVGSRELLTNLTLRELRGKYKRSLLGWSWSLLNPLASMVIFTIVFRTILQIPAPTGDPSGLTNFPLYLLTGLLPWSYLANNTNVGMGALVSNAGLIKKVAFPRQTLLFATSLSLLISFGIEMLLLVVVLLIAGNMVLPWLVPTVVLMVLLGLFSTGITLALAPLNVYFRDLQYLWSIAMQMWFYATPIVYPLSYVPDSLLPFIELNPATQFVLAFHRLPLRPHLASAHPLGVPGSRLGRGVRRRARRVRPP